MLAASSLALGRALMRRGDRPQSVKALVPVNTRTGEAGDLGNDISFVTVDLPVRETDPLDGPARASATPHAHASRAARRGRCARSRRPPTFSPRRPARHHARRGARRRVQRRRLERPRARPSDLTLLGPPADRDAPRRARSCTATRSRSACCRYAGRLQAGIYADAEVLPDAVEVARDLEQALDALRVGHREQAPTPWRERARERRRGVQRAKR